MDKIVINEIAREKIVNGAKKLCDIVKLTIGPRGNNVILANGGNPIITNDGVTIARNVVLDDAYENVAAKIFLNTLRPRLEDDTVKMG